MRQEDFDEEDQELIGKLAYSLNTFMDQVIFLFNKNVDFQNLNQEVRDITIITASDYATTGNLVNPPNIRTNLNSKVQGIICISATNLVDPTVFATNQPFVSFTLLDNETISILNVSGLQASSQYSLKLLLIGQD